MASFELVNLGICGLLAGFVCDSEEADHEPHGEWYGPLGQGQWKNRREWEQWCHFQNTRRTPTYDASLLLAHKIRVYFDQKSNWKLLEKKIHPNFSSNVLGKNAALYLPVITVNLVNNKPTEHLLFVYEPFFNCETSFWTAKRSSWQEAGEVYEEERQNSRRNQGKVWWHFSEFLKSNPSPWEGWDWGV